MPLSADPRRLQARAYPWSLLYQTRFADLDVNQHLNNVAIARIYEEGRVRFSLDWRRDHPATAAVRFLVAHVAVDYLDEGSYPEPVTVCTAVLALGRSSLRYGQALFQHGRCIGLADTVLVHRGADGPAPLPDAVRQALAPRLLQGS